MWLFFTVVAILVVLYNRRFLQKYAKTVPYRGVSVDLREYVARYPTFTTAVNERVDAFNKAFSKTFEYKNATYGTVNELYSICSDVTYNMHEIRFRLPNDLADEKKFIGISENLERSLMEHIADAKARFNIFVAPGPLSSAYQARQYRASNDVII